MKNKIFNKSIACFLTVIIIFTLFPASLAAQPLPADIKGFNKSVFDSHFSRADREINPGRWFSEAEFGVTQAVTAWESLAFGMYDDPLLFEEAKNRIKEWSQNELEERFSKWLTGRFFGTAIEKALLDFTQTFGEINKNYTWNLDSEGNIIFDDKTGAPLIIRPDSSREFSADLLMWRDDAGEAVVMKSGSFDAMLSGSFTELLAFIPNELRESLNTVINRTDIKIKGSIRQEFENIASREERIFTSRRTRDIQSLRRKSDDEAAGIFTQRLISETEEICSRGIEELKAKIEEAAAGTGDLALLGEDWLRLYREQFERGLKAWEEAEERFFIRRIEWEQESFKLFSEGEETWSLAFSQFEDERRKWELKAKELFDSGEAMFKNISENFEKSITEARREFEINAAMRIGEGTAKVKALVDMYLLCSSAAISVMDNLQYWHDQYSGSGKVNPKNPDFNAWLAREESRTKSASLAEIRKSYDLYVSYMEKAFEAREKIIANYADLIGTGALKDILSPDASSEDFHLDEYQITLIRAKALVLYWERKTKITKAVLSYAEDLSAGRMTETEGLYAWEKAKAAYNESIFTYENELKKLDAIGEDIQAQKEILQKISGQMLYEEEKLNKLNSEYSSYFNASVVNRADYYIADLNQLYEYLEKEYLSFLLSGTDSVYKTVLEYGIKQDNAERRETAQDILNFLIDGINQQFPSLSELENLVREGKETDINLRIRLAAIDLFTDNTSGADWYSKAKGLEMSDKEKAELYGGKLNVKLTDDFNNSSKILLEKRLELELNSLGKFLNLIPASIKLTFIPSENSLIDSGFASRAYEALLLLKERLDLKKPLYSMNENENEIINYFISGGSFFTGSEQLLSEYYSEYFLSSALLDLFTEYGYNSSFYKKELLSDSLNAMKNLLTGLGINQSAGFLPDIQDICNLINKKEGDFILNASQFLMEFDNCFSVMPKWLETETAYWKNALVEYIASFAYFTGLNPDNLALTLNIKQNEINEKYNELYKYADSLENYNDDEMEKINRAYAEIKDCAVLLFYAEKLRQELEEININEIEGKKHWRQFVTAGYVKTEEPAVETVSAWKDGILKDASFAAFYYTNRLKDSIEIYLNNDFEYLNENSYLLSGLYYEKIKELNDRFNLLPLLQNEIADKGKLYELTKIPPKELEAQLKLSHDALKAQEAAFNAIKNKYFHEAEIFMNTGLLYDKQYSFLKKAHEDTDKKRFEYEKQDAIQVWASTAYSETNKYSIENCYSNLSRAQAVLAVLSDLYNGEDRRSYEDTEYNALYSEYEQSFERKIKILEAAENLKIALAQEKTNNEKIFKEYHNSLMQLGSIDQNYLNYISSNSRSQWSLKDIIMLKDGRLVFSRDASMRLSGVNEEKANALHDFFAYDECPDGERFIISDYEESLRELSQRMSGYLKNADKYRQWGLARDFLINSMIKANTDLSFLNRYYSGLGQIKNGGSLGSLLLKTEIFEKPDTLSSMEFYDRFGTILEVYQRQAWQSLSEKEKSDLEYYIILTLSGNGNNYLSGFSQLGTRDMYQLLYDTVDQLNKYAEDEIDKWYKTVGLIVLVPFYGIPRIISLIEMHDINKAALERIETVLLKTQNDTSRWKSGLQGNLSSINSHSAAYKASCKRLDILEGKNIKGDKIVWDDIKLVLETAGKTDTKTLETYWNLMLSESDLIFSDVSQALDGLLDWARNREEKNKTAFETRWQNDYKNHKANESNLKFMIDEYMRGTVSIDSLKSAAEKTYGKNAAAWKNHHENVYMVLLNDLSLYLNSKYDFHSEYSIPGVEITNITVKLMENKYAAELMSRETEWEQMRFDINEKHKDWQDSIAKILENGRADWKASVLKMEESYKQWKVSFQNEYKRVSDEWALAYLAGLEDKEKWLEQAASAADHASVASFLTLVGTEGERLSRFLDAREPMGIRGAIPQTDSLMAALLQSSGIANLYSAFNALDSAASIASPVIRRGIGGTNAWDASLTKAAASDLARKTNTEIADRESRMIANNVRLYAEEAINNLKKEVELANTGFQDSMDNYFILEGLWRKNGNNYEKNVIKGSTLIVPVINEAITISGYKKFAMNHVSLKTNLNEDFISGLDSITIMLLLENAEKELGTIAAEIFGTGSDSIIIRKNYSKDRAQSPGKFGAHIGYAPAVKPAQEMGDARKTMFYDEGSGELGRLVTEFIYWSYIEDKGILELTLAPWDKRIWNDEGSFFTAPSLHSAVTMTASIAAMIATTAVSAALTPVTGGASLSLMLITAAIGTGLGAGTELLFSAMDYSYGYKTLDEAAFSWGKSTLISAVSNFGSGLLGFAGNALTSGIDGIIKTAANTAITGVQNFTIGTINSALGAVTYNHNDKLGFSGDAFKTGMKGVITNSISSMTNTFTTGTLQNINSGTNLEKLSNFSNKNKNDLSALNNLIGSLSGQGVNYAMGGGFTLNVFNLSQLTKGAFSSGLLELNLGRDGVSMNFGTGGANVSFNNLDSALKGAKVWNVNNKIEDYSENNEHKIASALRALYGFGDDRQTEQLWEILKGGTEIKLVDNPGSAAQTIFDGKRTILLDSGFSGLNNEEQMRLAVILGHEAYRDGFVSDNNSLETRTAVSYHTEMALKMINDGQKLALDENLIMDLFAYNMGNDFFNSYVDNYYDSSADYWKLVVRNGLAGFEWDGNLSFDLSLIGMGEVDILSLDNAKKVWSLGSNKTFEEFFLSMGKFYNLNTRTLVLERTLNNTDKKSISQEIVKDQTDSFYKALQSVENSGLLMKTNFEINNLESKNPQVFAAGGGTMTSGYGIRAVDWGDDYGSYRVHNDWDLVNGKDSRLVAPMDGRINLDFTVGGGLKIVTNGGDKERITYTHASVSSIRSYLSVFSTNGITLNKDGSLDGVAQNMVIGVMGNTGTLTTGAHVHLTYEKNLINQDPGLFFNEKMFTKDDYTKLMSGLSVNTTIDTFQMTLNQVQGIFDYLYNKNEDDIIKNFKNFADNSNNSDYFNIVYQNAIKRN